jgi:hypothetical protein
MRLLIGYGMLDIDRSPDGNAGRQRFLPSETITAGLLDQKASVDRLCPQGERGKKSSIFTIRAGKGK